MKIWVDADAMPKAVKEILFRAAERLKIPVILVANQWQKTPNSAFISFVKVDQGFDVADDHIVDSCEECDLVITADIPLAAAAVEKGAVVLEPRGELLTAENVGQRLSMRDFMDELRGAEMVGGGPPPFSKTDRQRFANTLDRLLAQR